MSEEEQRHLDQRRTRRLEAAMAAGDEQAIQRAGGAGTAEAKEARRRVQVRRAAREGRQKRAEQIKAEQAQREQKKAQTGAQAQSGSTAQAGHRPATGADRRQQVAARADQARSAPVERRVQEVKDMNRRAAQSARERAERSQKAGQRM
ncbi:hypothetical protein [Gordonia humi]|uniref:Uncharacterized protein n=1 Tax=Gordonia humi TaxID=686429 RepID=A0A840EPN6_9ACTN|nr:hypothetical protein [Gordonia humi]MBB4134785.1 hypothetical protein [Gordonia humi]